MDLSDLATEAAALLAGYALAIGQDVADKARTGIAERLYGVIKEKLGRRASDARALENLMQEPADVRHQEVVAAALDAAMGEDPEFGERLRREVMAIRGYHSQVATATGPIAGNQIVSNIGPGVSISDAIVNNQGTVDQSRHTIHDRRRTTHKWGIPPLWLAIIVLVVGLVVSGTTTYIIISGKEPPDAMDTSPTTRRPASDVGGGGCGTDCNLILETDPYNAVNKIYDDVAQGDERSVCVRFTTEARQQFTANHGFDDCEKAAAALHDQVTDINKYANSMPTGFDGEDVGDAKTVRISSCDDNRGYGIQGGPPLGAFTVEEIPGSVAGQWIITKHEAEDC